MDPIATLAFAREIIDIDSTTGSEAAASRWLAQRLRDLGYRVEEQELDRGRANVWATPSDDPPSIVFSTHIDCVPPFFPSSVRDGRLYGRGACDAKGILAAQVAASERLRASGERRAGLLFVVGEERGSDGAAAANTLANSVRFLINGEPTDNRLATGTRGTLRVRLAASGRAAHSSAPEQGESAVEKLLEALSVLKTLPLPSTPDFGHTFYNIGLIEGGVAPNIIPPRASAEIMFRTVGPADDVLAVTRRLEPLVRVTEVLRIEPVRMHVVPGFPTASFAFTTDVPLMDRWGSPLLFGPGSILVAHTDHEHVLLSELEAAVDAYVRLARTLMIGPHGQS
jgi:acetylornithine deacetylase